MSTTNELTVSHHDFSAKLRSVRDALSEPFDPEAAAPAIEVTLLLRGPMWRQAAWQDLHRDVVLAADAAIRLGREEDAAALLVYSAGIREALGDWRSVDSIVARAMRLRMNSETKAEALLHLGAASHNLGAYRKARRTFLQAQQDCVPEQTRSRILQKLYRTERALGRSNIAHKIMDQLIHSVPAKDRWFHAELLLDKASFVRETNPTSALSIAEEARERYVGLGFSRGEAYSDLDAGRSLRLLRDLTGARDRLSRAMAIFERTSYRPGVSHVRYEQARLALDKGNKSEAARLAGESYRAAAEVAYFAAMVRATHLQFHASALAMDISAAVAALSRLLWLGIRAMAVTLSGRLPLRRQLWLAAGAAA